MIERWTASRKGFISFVRLLLFEITIQYNQHVKIMHSSTVSAQHQRLRKESQHNIRDEGLRPVSVIAMISIGNW